MQFYAIVAASAETLAMAAHDLDLECKLYRDSAAALGIAQRAGIGKVRHLRTKGLWVQEVRISGRIEPRRLANEAHVGGAREPALEDVEHEALLRDSGVGSNPRFG